MTPSLRDRMADVLSGTELAGRLADTGAPFFERRAGDAAAGALEGPVLLGLARLLSTQREVAGFLSHRPELLERLSCADAGTLGARARGLEENPAEAEGDDLEAALDALRLLRREETCLAACLDLGGVVPFEEVSGFLSIVAETITQRALGLACDAVSPTAPKRALSVIGMGKIAGREFTYHSDLDLIFLYQGGAEEVVQASKIGQRLVAYLTTMTGAGIAYPVDTRLRPSGQQGMLVTSYRSFDRYQGEQAQTWEHLALLRARAISGDLDPAREVLERVRGRVLARRLDPWKHLADLRQRVVVERAHESASRVPFKTGRGGLMDVDFLAGGALLERGADRFPVLPSVAAMMRAAANGPRIEELLADYRFLRIVEARARWVAGRAVGELDAGGADLGAIAELVAPGLAPRSLLDELAAARRRIRRAYDAVIAAGTVGALEELPAPARSGPGA